MSIAVLSRKLLTFTHRTTRLRSCPISSTPSSFISSTMTALPPTRPVLPLPTKDCTGKTVIITGANTGIGKEVATHFARLSAAHIILASRNVENCKDAVEQAQKAATGKDAKAECWQLDLSDFKSVQAFVEKAKNLERLDALVMNAAVSHPTRVETVDGFDTTLQVNGLSTGFICAQLLPLIETTAVTHPDENFKPHLTLVTSGNILNATKEAFVADEGKGIVQSMNDAGTPRSDKEFPFQLRYGVQTKGFNAMNAYTLGKSASPNVVVNCVCPGLVVTSLSRNAPEEFKAYLRGMWEKVGIQPEEGARNVVWASTEITPPGALVQHCAVNENPTGFVFSDEGHEVATQIWKEFEEIWKERGLI